MGRVACPRCRRRFEAGDEGARGLACPACGSPLRRDSRKLEKPRHLGRYRLDSYISAGTRGTVFRGIHVDLDLPVAVKILDPGLATDPECAARFEREARLAAQIRHPHVVRVLDVGREDDTHYLVMDLVEGRDLKAMVLAKGPLPIEQAVGLVLEAGRGLAAAHAHGVVHRDVKPGNLILDKAEGRVVLTDFGMAKNLRLDEQLTAEGTILGTPSTMAPEIVQGEEATARSDLYSLAVTLYYLLAGVHPYRAETSLGVLKRHVHDPIPDVRSERADCPAGVAEAIARAMAKDPEMRHPSVEAFLGAVEAGRGAIEAATAGGRRRRSGAWLAVGIGLVALVGVDVALRVRESVSREVEAEVVPGELGAFPFDEVEVVVTASGPGPVELVFEPGSGSAVVGRHDPAGGTMSISYGGVVVAERRLPPGDAESSARSVRLSWRAGEIALEVEDAWVLRIRARSVGPVRPALRSGPEVRVESVRVRGRRAG